ncbi:MAG: DNA polymerase ligase N-terminal domain-containing protein [bacterium]|nr:DNA polymerase ligase N-terminal domain-containing protein [bacterium]
MKKLEKYTSMRDPGKTPEPFTSKDIDPEKLVYVVQKHSATALHYDFRLEMGGVMPSWAIPKGPSLDNSVKRLAMQTEDHPLDYRHFEGVIPAGEYGAGPVIIWDEGWYLPETEISPGIRKEIRDKKEGEKAMLAGLEKGEIKFFLYGKKLKGSFTLVKTKGFPPGKAGKNAWLLIKHKDHFVVEGYDAAEFKESALSGKTLEEIKEKG